MSTLKKISMWILTVLLVIAFSAAGLPKVMSSPVWVRLFSNWGYPHWMLIVVGLLEVLGGVALLNSKTAPYGAITLTIIMVGAGYTHVAAREGYAVFRPAIFLGLIGTTVWLRNSR